MTKLLHYLTWITIVSALLIMSVATFWLVYPYTVTDMYNQPFPVDKEIYKSGEYITYTVDYCKYHPISPTLSRSFVDGLIYNIPDSIGNIYTPGCGSTKVLIYIPIALPPGQYAVHTTFRWSVNPLKTIETTTRTQKFTVIK